MTIKEWKNSAQKLRQFWQEVTDDDGGESPQMVMTRHGVEAIEQSVAEVERLRAELVEERTAILELQREACARDGVPMPSERPLVDTLRAEVERLREALRNVVRRLVDFQEDTGTPDSDTALQIARAALPEEPADEVTRPVRSSSASGASPKSPDKEG